MIPARATVLHLKLMRYSCVPGARETVCETGSHPTHSLKGSEASVTAASVKPGVSRSPQRSLHVGQSVET